MSSVNEVSSQSYEALSSDMPPNAPHLNAQNTTAQFNVHAVPLMYDAPAAAQIWKVPTVAPQWSLATVIPQIAESSAFYQTFLKGKPQALGIVLIVVAILQVALGIGLFFMTCSISFPSGIPFWGPIIYIIAGSLTIAAKAKPNICLVKGSLALSIITSVFTIIGLILACVDLHIIKFLYHHRNAGPVGGYIMDSVLLVTNLLLFCSSVSVAVFGCRSLNHASSIVPQVFVIQNDVVISMPPSVFSASAPQYAELQPPPPPPPPPPPYMVQEQEKARPMD